MYDIIILTGGIMEKYKNEEYLKHTIMDQSRHLFLYGYDGSKRKQFLEDMASSYPIVLDKESPMAIYVTEFALPKIESFNSGFDKYKIDLVSREFLYFSIVSDILLKTMETNDLTLLNDRISNLIVTLNKFLNKDYSPMRDLNDLIKVLIESKEFYKRYYMEYYGKGNDILSINDIALPFMQFDMVIGRLKNALNNNSYFGIILDKQNDIALSSTKAINGLVGSRINKDISMKIATEPDKWTSYVDSNGQLVERIHDYGVVELDDSESQYLKRIKRDI